jgi:hypothetical protein
MYWVTNHIGMDWCFVNHLRHRNRPHWSTDFLSSIHRKRLLEGDINRHRYLHSEIYVIECDTRRTTATLTVFNNRFLILQWNDAAQILIVNINNVRIGYFAWRKEGSLRCCDVVARLLFPVGQFVVPIQPVQIAKLEHSILTQSSIYCRYLS